VTHQTREVPPHMADDSIFGKPDLRISEELSHITKPLYEEYVPEQLNLATIPLRIFPDYSLSATATKCQPKPG
jgi:hypothetical protein